MTNMTNITEYISARRQRAGLPDEALLERYAAGQRDFSGATCAARGWRARI